MWIKWHWKLFRQFLKTLISYQYPLRPKAEHQLVFLFLSSLHQKHWCHWFSISSLRAALSKKWVIINHCSGVCATVHSFLYLSAMAPVRMLRVRARTVKLIIYHQTSEGQMTGRAAALSCEIQLLLSKYRHSCWETRVVVSSEVWAPDDRFVMLGIRTC